MEPKFRDVNPPDPVAYVLSLNLHRRQLSPSQASMVGSRAEELREKLQVEAERRMKSGKGADGSGGRGNKKNPEVSVPQGFQEPHRNKQTRDVIGEMVGVSGSMIDRATKVRTKGVPELTQAVDEGRMSVTAAAKLTEEPDRLPVMVGLQCPAC